MPTARDPSPEAGDEGGGFGRICDSCASPRGARHLKADFGVHDHLVALERPVEDAAHRVKRVADRAAGEALGDQLVDELREVGAPDVGQPAVAERREDEAAEGPPS